MTDMDIEFASCLIAFSGIVAALVAQLVGFRLPPEPTDRPPIRFSLELVNYVVGYFLNFSMLVLTPIFAWAALKAIGGVVGNNREAIWGEAASSARVGVTGLLILAIVELLFWSLMTFLSPLFIVMYIESAATSRPQP